MPPGYEKGGKSLNLKLPPYDDMK